MLTVWECALKGPDRCRIDDLLVSDGIVRPRAGAGEAPSAGWAAAFAGADTAGCLRLGPFTRADDLLPTHLDEERPKRRR